MTELLAATAAAFGLGLMTAISPCPLATNIAAISFVARQVDSPRKVLLAGLMYTLGRMLAYTALAALLVWTLMETPVVSQWLQKYMNKLLGPALILVGMILTGLVESSASTSVVGERTQRRAESLGLWGAGMLGVLFAMSFCPISAGWFFGSLIPMAVKYRSGILLPAAFGVATGLPVLVFAVPISLGAGWVAKAYDKLTAVERWGRTITGAIFICVGIYYCLTYIFGIGA